MVIRIFEPWVFIELLKLSAFGSLFLDALLDLEGFVDQSLEDWAVLHVDGLLATGAVHETECYSGSHPLLLEEGFDAVEVEDMATSQLDCRLGTQSTDEANIAV